MVLTLVGAGLAYAATRPPDVVRIGAAGDIACGPDKPEFTAHSLKTCQQLATSQLLVDRRQAKQLDAVLPLGDNQYDDGTLAQFQGSYAPSWGRLNDIAHPVPGNHEYRDHKGAGYWDYFGASAGERGKGWYSYDLGQWHLIAINGTCDEIDCSAGSEEVTWLRADLAAHDNKCTLAYWHYPLFSGGHDAEDATGADTSGSLASDKATTTYGDLRVRPLVQALYDAGADVILNGHNHVYERFDLMRPDGSLDPARGIREFVVGTGGRSHYTSKPVPHKLVGNDDTYGVLLMTLKPDGYDWNFVPTVAGGFTDSGSGTCH